jgi:biopolymer transport protein ExbD
MNFRKRMTQEEPEINLIPLIDLFLVIIIFLMVTTTYSKFAELQINLPTADAEKQLERPNEINIAVTNQGKFNINNAQVPFVNVEGLAADLKRAAAGKKDPVVVINADSQATHQSVVHVMEAARLAGLAQISFATQTSQGK